MPSWNPEIYDRCKEYRDRSALDLLLRIPADLDPREIWDLGCGAGEQAALLAARHPAAKVRGLDSSPDMLAAARRRLADVDWVQGDIADFAPAVPPDLIYANASLQWLDSHATLFPWLASLLEPGGVLACQMPLSFDTAWHTALRETASEPRWAPRFDGLRGGRRLASAESYYDWLSPLCEGLDIWSTTYLHVLQGDNAVMHWMRGTGLRPYLDALPDPDEQTAFLDSYRRRLAVAVPTRADGVTLFAFPRLFIVARRRIPPGAPLLLD